VAYAATGNSITYSPIGSGSGKNQFASGIADFTISDVAYGSGERKPAKDIVYVPIVAGPIAITYNLQGCIGTIKLTKYNLSKIFAGQITNGMTHYFKDNPSKLPNKPIKVIYRIDGSGTSEVFTIVS
jgi:phosphate transport system substrate-binding protein